MKLSRVGSDVKTAVRLAVREAGKRTAVSIAVGAREADGY